MILNIFKSNLLKNAGAYTLFNIADKAIPFLIIPVITRLLPVEEVGYYTLYQAVFNILVPIITVSIGSSILLNFYKLEYVEFKKYFSNGVYLFLVVGVLTFTLILFLSQEIATFLKFPPFWLRVSVIIVGLQFFNTLRKYLWQAKKQIFNFGLFSVLLTLVKNISGIVFIIYFNLGWEGIVLGHLLGEFLFSLWCFYTFYKENLLVFDVNKSYIEDILNVGFPLSLHSIGAWLSNSMNRILISTIIGKVAVGSYGVGATFGMLLTLVQLSFNNAFTPYLFERLKNPNAKIKFALVKITYYYYIAIILFALGMSFFGYYFVSDIFGSSYLDTRNFIIPLIFSAAVNGMYKMHVNYIFFMKKTLMITKITLVSGAINMILAYIMVSAYGVLGAAYSALFIQVLTYLTTFYFSNKLYPMPWFKFKTASHEKYSTTGF